MAAPYDNDKQGFVPVAEPITPQDDSTGQAKSQFYELETPRPQSAIPASWSHKRGSLVVWGVRYMLTVVLVGVVLAIPIILFSKDQLSDDDTLETAEEKQYRNLVFYLFLWFLITWLGACISDIFILALPYIFRFVAGYINPAHQRYWRIFRTLRKPVTFLGFIIASYISFQILINDNDLLAVNLNKDPNPDFMGWDDVIFDVLEQTVFWVVGYLLERIVILYICVHYHYRTDQVRITHSKEMHKALVALYEASIYLHPVNSPHFVVEDAIIRNSSGSGSESASRQNASQLLRKVGMDGHKIVSFFGSAVKSDTNSHWLHPAAPYAVVERALSHPKSAAALAKRIWMSLVVQGQQAFSAEDIAEVLGPYRREEALKIFKIIDENESGDIRLDEMVWTVVEAGRIRHAIYQGMADINHCINIFDWISLLILAAVMIFFILIVYVPTIREIQSTAGYFVIGLAFAVGRIFNKFLMGCIFVFFEHPFDVGDRVNIYNRVAGNVVSAVVTRQSILYTVFRRIDNGTDLQITNERLAQKRVENISRSGVNKQQFTICVDFKTSFRDITYLRSELESFLAANPRDYEPALGLTVVNIHELNKLELSVSFTHKSNWSNERLRACRSSKFMCALVAVIRRIPLYKPGGATPNLGEDGKPMYTVAITDTEAAEKVKAANKKRADARYDAINDAEKEKANDDEAARKKAEKEAAENEAEVAALTAMTQVPPVAKAVKPDEAESTGVDTLINHVSTGLRSKSVPGPAGMFYKH